MWSTRTHTHTYTKELNDAMICGTVVVIQYEDAGLVYMCIMDVCVCVYERARDRMDWIKQRVCPSILSISAQFKFIRSSL